MQLLKKVFECLSKKDKYLETEKRNDFKAKWENQNSILTKSYKN